MVEGPRSTFSRLISSTWAGTGRRSGVGRRNTKPSLDNTARSARHLRTIPVPPKSAPDCETRNARRQRDLEKSQRVDPGKERDDHHRGWKDNRLQDRNTDQWSADNSRKGSAGNHRKTVQGTGDNGTHRQKRRGTPGKSQSTPQPEQQRQAKVRGPSGSASPAHIADGNTSTPAS